MIYLNLANNLELKLLKSIKKTLPEKRVDAYKKVFAMAIDVQEDHLQAGGTLAFKHEGNNALENALKFANAEGKEVEDEYYAGLKKEREKPGFWQRGYNAIADLFTGDDEKQTAVAGTSVQPSGPIDLIVTKDFNVPDELVQTLRSNYFAHKDPKLAAEGAPRNFKQYETLMQKLSKESGVPIQMLRALGKRESGIHVQSNGQLSGWSPLGDTNQGTGASMGIFHVRSSESGAAVEQYNEDNGTNYNWKDIASNPRLSATIGAWYFKYWLDRTDGDPIEAYMRYNGGPGGNLKPKARANAEKYAKDLDYFQESKFIKKSAILEGIAKAA